MAETPERGLHGGRGDSRASRLSSQSTLDVIGPTITLGPVTDDVSVVTVTEDGMTVVGDVTSGGDGVPPGITVNVAGQLVALVATAGAQVVLAGGGVGITSGNRRQSLPGSRERTDQ